MVEGTGASGAFTDYSVTNAQCAATFKCEEGHNTKETETRKDRVKNKTSSKKNAEISTAFNNDGC